MARQYFRTHVGEAPVVTQTQIAAAAETILWNPAGLASNTAIAANAIAAGQTFKLTAWGTSTTAVTGSQTLIMKARFGTTASGTLLGAASPTQAVNAVARTDPWFLEMWVTFRKIGTAGEAICIARLDDPKVVGTAATTNSSMLTCGNTTTTATAVDTTVAAGLLITLQPSLSTYTFNCLEVIMETVN
jgi:hypothetical protein